MIKVNKGLLINLFQYAFIAVPLVILVLKVMNYYTPEEDNSKGSLEILLEVIVSISILLLAVWFINKIIRYIPNISKLEYPEFNEVKKKCEVCGLRDKCYNELVVKTKINEIAK